MIYHDVSRNSKFEYKMCLDNNKSIYPNLSNPKLKPSKYMHHAQTTRFFQIPVVWHQRQNRHSLTICLRSILKILQPHSQCWDQQSRALKMMPYQDTTDYIFNVATCCRCSTHIWWWWWWWWDGRRRGFLSQHLTYSRANNPLTMRRIPI